MTGAAKDALILADAVAALRCFSLIQVVGDGLFVHRLVQTVTRAALDAEAERGWAGTAVRIVRASWPSPANEATNWLQCQRLLPHALAAVEHGQRLEAELADCNRLLHEAAVYLRSRGQYHQARDLHEQGFAGLRRVLGDDHPDTLTSMNNLAETR